jgi:DnaK suppressor protein
MNVLVDVDYRPSDDEPFMNERQAAYFRQKLNAWKEEILRESRETITHLQDENHVLPDLADRASSETDRSLELRARDRQRKLISKIDAALLRIDNGTYGYCEETGDPISRSALMHAPSRRSRSKRRNATNGASGFTATTEETGRPFQRS